MYIQHFGCKEHPFRLSPDPNYLYLGKMHARAKSYMDFAADARDGFVVITGETGLGKTTLIQSLLSGLDDSVLAAKVHVAQLSDDDFLQSILVEFGFNPFNANKVELLNMLNMHLIEQYRVGKRAVLVVDEAHNLSKHMLEEVRLLSGLEAHQRNILNVLLVGKPELNDRLEEPWLELLLQRIRFRFQLAALEEKDAGDYIRHRIAVADGNQRLFSEEAVRLIYNFAGGVPRLINTLCDTAMICAFDNGDKNVVESAVIEAVKKLGWVPFAERAQRDETIARTLQDSGNKNIRKFVITMKGDVLGEYPLYKDQITVGRDPGSDIYVDDKVVSRAHAQLITCEGEVYIEDLKSENGSYVNSRRIDRCKLQYGDLIAIGSCHIKYVDELFFLPGNNNQDSSSAG